MNVLFAAMLTMLVGLGIAWKWEGIGGLLILGGLALFAVANHGVNLNLVFGGCWPRGGCLCSAAVSEAGGANGGLAPIDYATRGCRLGAIPVFTPSRFRPSLLYDQ